MFLFLCLSVSQFWTNGPRKMSEIQIVWLLTDGKGPAKTLHTLGRFNTSDVVDFLMDDKADTESVSSMSAASSYSIHTESSCQSLSTPKPPNREAKSSEKSKASRQTSSRSNLTKAASSSRASKASPIQASGASKQGSTRKTPTRRKSTVISSKSLMRTEEADDSSSSNSRKAGGSNLKRSNTDIKKMVPKVVLRRMSDNSVTAPQKKSQAVPSAEKPARRRLKEQFEEASTPRDDGTPRRKITRNTR